MKTGPSDICNEYSRKLKIDEQERKITFQVEDEHIQRQGEAQHCGMFWKIEPFLHDCDRGLCGEVARMKQRAFLELNWESPFIAIKVWILNQWKEWFPNYVP